MKKRNNIIYLTKDGYETLEKFYANFDDMKKFMQLVLDPDQYDCWLYQNQYIKDLHFGDKPIYKIKQKPSTTITLVDDFTNEKGKLKRNQKDVEMYLDVLNERIKRGRKDGL